MLKNICFRKIAKSKIETNFETMLAEKKEWDGRDYSIEFNLPPLGVTVFRVEAAKKKKGSGEPNRQKVGTVSWDQIKVIAEDKMADLNAFKVESAMRMVAGTARSMGITVKGAFPSN